MKTFFISIFVSWSLVAHQVERTFPIKYTFSVDENLSGISKYEFEIILNMFDELFGKPLGNKTINWKRDIDWNSSYIGAGSNVLNGDFYILLFGGLVRAKYMTIGALSAVLCHEFGHKLGGFPRQQFPGEDVHWSSSEGQADTFAAVACLPQVYDWLKKMAPHLIHSEFEPVTFKLCKTATNQERCRWVATSGIDLIQSLQVYFETDRQFADPLVESHEKPDQSLITAYPSYQCRMDIYKTHAANPTAPRLTCWYVD